MVLILNRQVLFTVVLYIPYTLALSNIFQEHISFRRDGIIFS